MYETHIYEPHIYLHMYDDDEACHTYINESTKNEFASFSYMCMAWLIDVCVAWTIDVCVAWLLDVCVAWLIDVCVVWLIDVCVALLIDVCVAWLFDVCVAWLIDVCVAWLIDVCVAWLIIVIFHLHLNVLPVLKCVPWLIDMGGSTHSCLWHDSLIWGAFAYYGGEKYRQNSACCGVLQLHCVAVCCSCCIVWQSSADNKAAESID